MKSVVPMFVLFLSGEREWNSYTFAIARYGHILKHTICEGVFCGTKPSSSQICPYRQIPTWDLLHHWKLLQLKGTAWEGSAVLQTCIATEPEVFVSMDPNGTWVCGNEEYTSCNWCVSAGCWYQSSGLSCMVWVGANLWNFGNALLCSLLLQTCNTIETSWCSNVVCNGTMLRNRAIKHAWRCYPML